jgi:hypothetical protein
MLLGRTRTNLLVLVDLPPSAVGEYHDVVLTGTTGATFTATVVGRRPGPQLAVVS